MSLQTWTVCTITVCNCKQPLHYKLNINRAQLHTGVLTHCCGSSKSASDTLQM